MFKNKRTLILGCGVALVVLLGTLFAASLQAQPGKKISTAPLASGNAALTKPGLSLTGPSVVQASAFIETPAIRDLPSADDSYDLEAARNARLEELNEQNTGDLFAPDAKAPKQYDGALQATWSARKGFRFVASIPAPNQTFEGVPVQNTAPPDTTGAVGPNDYVQCVNTLCRIYDKTGVARGPAFAISSLFKGFGGVAANTDRGDPIVLYDRMANRWLISQFAFAVDANGNPTVPPYHQVIAISKTGDPTGAYWGYDFVLGGTTNQNDLNDYPKFGVWPDGYYYTDRQFTNGGAYNGFGCYAFDRNKMLAGDPTASYIYFNAGTGLSNASSGMIPSDFYGLTPPPAGAPNVFAVETDDAFGDPSDALRLFDFHANFSTSPATGTFIERPESPLAVAAFDSRNPAGRGDIAQPSPAASPNPSATPATPGDYLDSIGDRLMLRLFYINRGGVESLTTCHTVNALPPPAPGVLPIFSQYQAGTRWYILNRTTPSGNWAVGDQGTFAPDANNRWMGSTAMDNAGNLAVGYSVSSTTIKPSLYYAGRLAADPAGTLNQGEALMFAGNGVQTDTGNRWGDYSNMSLDPTDDATFWFTSEYIPANGTFNWHTRVGSFKFANTTASAQGTLSGTVTACDSGAAIKDAIVQVSGGPSTGFSSATDVNGNYSFNVAPGNYTVTVTDPAHSCSTAGPFNVAITTGNTTTQNACVTGSPQFIFNAVSVLSGAGNANGNGVIEPNECNAINVTLLNNGCAIGSNVFATLSTSTSGVTVTQPNSPYSDTTENGTPTNLAPFQFSTDNTVACGSTISFVLTLHYDGGTTTVPFSVPTCNIAPVVASGALVNGTDAQLPNGRLSRTAVGASCAVPKACPGVLGTGARLFRQHMFTNGPAPTCVTINTVASCPSPANDIIPVAYNGSFDPNNICTNYLGDPGGSPGAAGNSFSVNLAANATLVVVVEEANAGLAGCSGYTVSVSGLVGTGTGNGVCPASPSVVSRKQHGAFGNFDIAMPLTGPTGVEDRGVVGGNHTIVLTYPTDPTGATATVLARNPSATSSGSVSGTSFSGNDLIVNLTGVSTPQILVLSVSGGTGISPAVVPIGILIGDSNGDRKVNSADATQVRNRSGATSIDSTNYRSDVNFNGSINSSDATIVRNNSGLALPY